MYVLRKLEKLEMLAEGQGECVSVALDPVPDFLFEQDLCQQY